MSKDRFHIKQIHILLFGILMTCLEFSCMAQSKKEIIHALNLRIDSLNSVVEFERSKLQFKLTEMDSSINYITNENYKLKSEITQLTEYQVQLEAKNQEQINFLIKSNSTKSDSIFHITESNKLLAKRLQFISDSLRVKLDTVQFAIPEGMLDIKTDFWKESFPNEISRMELKKPVTSTMKDIVDWLNQFHQVHSNAYSFYDEKTARFYSGDQPARFMGMVTVENCIFKEGIVFQSRYEYEGAMYQLFVPILTIAECQISLEALCRAMGGCLQPEEVIVEYEESEFGVRITWGGGC